MMEHVTHMVAIDRGNEQGVDKTHPTDYSPPLFRSLYYQDMNLLSDDVWITEVIL